jgi:RNA recognition motif-containing protein
VGQAQWPAPNDLPSRRDQTCNLSDVGKSSKRSALFSFAQLCGLILIIVHLDYRNFIPSGRAWVVFADSQKAEDAMQLLRGSTLAGHAIRAQKTDEQQVIDAGLPARTRGPKGRAEALERGLTNGYGPDAKLRERGNNVYLWGLPGTTLAPELTKLFDSYGLRVTVEEPQAVQKLER